MLESAVGSEGAAVDLPGEQRLRHEAEYQVRLFAVQVASPRADAPVLEPLVEPEAEEQHRLRDHDPVHETRDLVGGHGVEPDRDPRGDTCHGAEPERHHDRLGAIRRVEALLQPAEQDHRHVGAGDPDQGGDLGDARVRRDQQHHDRGADGVFDPPESVDAST